MTGKELAERVGVTQATISSIVTGNSFPKTDLLLNIAKELDMDLRDLFIATKKRSKEDIIESVIRHLESLKNL